MCYAMSYNNGTLGKHENDQSNEDDILDFVCRSKGSRSSPLVSFRSIFSQAVFSTGFALNYPPRSQKPIKNLTPKSEHRLDLAPLFP